MLALAEPDAPAKLESLLAAAQRAQARSDYRAAADAYREALSIRPDLAELWSNLGVMRYESQDYPQAEEAFRRALSINKSLFVPNLFLGLDLLDSKRPREAVGYLLAAQKLNGQDTQAILALGRAFHALLESAQSRDWYQRAAALAPSNGEAWYGLGLAFLGLAQSSGAKLAAFSHSAYVAELTADAFAKQGRGTEALQAYRELLASNEQPPRCARTAYGLVLLRHGDRTQAKEQFERDHDACPVAQHPDAARQAQSPPERPVPALDKLTKQNLEQFASDAFFSGDFRAAARAADRLERRYPNNAAGWYWAVRTNQELGVAALAHAGEVEPDSPRIHALLGDAYQQRRMFREAEREYSKILALEPDSVAGFAGLSAAYLRDGNPEQAQANAQKALARSPEDSELNLLMGEIMVAEHKYAEAEPYLKHSLNARPDLLARVHALLGRIYARIGRPKEAMSELTQGLASDEDGSVYYQLARLYQSSGDAKAAAAAFEKSNRVRSRHQNPAIEILAPVQAQGDSPER